MIPKRRYLPQLPTQLANEQQAVANQLLVDAIHDLNGKIQFVYEQLELLAASSAFTIEPMED